MGIDIIGDSIAWCAENITPAFPNFEFVHFDVKDQLHNPTGKQRSIDRIIPLPDDSVDRIILWSVFTHMFEDDIVHYLKDFRRVLKPDGLVFATCFIIDEDVLSSARKTNLTPFDLQFRHPFAEGCRVNNIDYPAGAVAFTEAKCREMIESSGLEMVKPFQRGGWSGFFSRPDGPGQDAMILGRRRSDAIAGSHVA